MEKPGKLPNFLYNLRLKFRLSGDVTFRTFTTLIACNIFVILGLMLLTILQESWLSIETYGLRFLWGVTWQPVPPRPDMLPSFGALPLIWGTLVTSAIALLLGVPLSLGIGLALSEFAPKRFAYFISFLIKTFVFPSFEGKGR